MQSELVSTDEPGVRIMRRLGTFKPFGRCTPRQLGIALIEALVAMAIMLGGMAAILGFHSSVTGNSAQNRLTSAALGAAQAKLEELRNDDFDDLADGSDSVDFINPGIGGAFSTTLDRCWSFTEVQSNLLRADVTVVRGGDSCDSATQGLANLSTLIARTDPRIAARNVDVQRRADGDGHLVQGYQAPDGSTASGLPGGFEKIVDSSGNLIAIYNPDKGDAIVPKRDDTPLKYALIHGNIIFKGQKSATDVGTLDIGVEGVASCRIFYPGQPGAPPTITGGGNTATYIQYSCVVADQWRRAIYLLPPAGQHVCVGYPGLQPEDEPEDVLRFQGRHYYGFGWKLDSNGNKLKTPAGMRGASDGSAVIGSVCMQGEACWDDTAVRGWVPGGHHFFIKSSADNQSCAEAMQVLQAIDAATTDPHSMFAQVLFRNPHKVYCTNDKEYTNELPKIQVHDEPVVVTDCYSTTRVSGFMLNADQESLDGWTISLGSSSRFQVPCRPMGRFGTHGGGYVCGYGEDVSNVRVTAYAFGHTFNPSSYSGMNPLDIPHDFVLKNFEFRKGQISPSDPDDPDTPDDPIELTSCPAGVRIEVELGNHKDIHSASYGGTHFSCTEVGQGSNTKGVCTLSGDIPFDATVVLNWRMRVQGSWVTQPSKNVTIGAGHLQRDRKSVV